MSVEFNSVGRPNPKNPAAPKKYYPSVKATGHRSLRELSKRISKMSTVSSTDTLAVLEALLQVIPEELKAGNVVDLGEFGSFWLRNTSTGVDAEEQVSARQVTNLLVRFIPSKEFKQAIASVRLVKARKRNR